jgi:hypothetical protein
MASRPGSSPGYRSLASLVSLILVGPVIWHQPMQGTRQGHHAKVEHTGECLNEGDQAAEPKVHRRGRPDRRANALRLPRVTCQVSYGGRHGTLTTATIDT